MSQTQPLRTARATLAACPPPQRYGVGIRVFTDRRLLRQIRSEIVRNAMAPGEIAVLENVTAEVLIALLEQRAEPPEDSGALLREFAASRAGFEVLAWRTTRGHCSKLHILDAEGIALCGTPRGTDPVPIHSGVCSTCAVHAQLEPPPGAVRVVELDSDGLPWNMPSVPSAL